MVALFLRPDADIADGGWTDEGGATTLFDAVDESSFSDTDYIKSTVAAGDKVSLRLSDPGATVDEPFTVRYRCKREGLDAANLTVRLYEATSPPTLIMEFDHGSVTDAFATYTHNLTATEFAAIGDFNNLYLEFEANPTSTHNGAIIDLNFVTADYFEDSNPGAVVTDFLSCSRASIGYAKTATGTLTQFASNVLRITNLGLLVEDSRTNGHVYSEDMTGVNWAITRINTSAGQTAPNGASTATKLIPTTESHTHYFNQGSTNIPHTANVPFTMSTFAKADGYSWLIINLYDNVSNADAMISYNLTTGATATLSNSGWTSLSHGTEQFGNGWWRCWVTGTTATGTVVRPYYQLTTDGTANQTFAGDGTSGIQVWGFQAEPDVAFMSSYIPTTTTSATRAADVVTLSAGLTNILYADPSTVLVDAKRNNSDFTSLPVMIGGDANFFACSGVVQAQGWNGSSSVYSSSTLSTWVDGLKAAYAEDGSGRSICAGGGTVGTDANKMISPNTTVTLGSNGGALSVWGYIRRIAFWISRLSDTALQTLTAP